MEEIVRQVIYLDKAGQAKIAALEKEKEQLSIVMKEMRQTLSSQYQKETEKQEAQIKEQIEKDFSCREQELKTLASEKEKIILHHYQDNKDEWLKQLLAFCLGEKE